jgi:hypothetical protein
MIILVTIICAVLLVALVTALIFSAKFRQDILGGTGEARVLGILSVKGAAVVLLVGIFLGGLIWSVPENNLIEKNKSPKEPLSLREVSLSSKVTIDSLNKALTDYKAESQNLDTAKQILENELKNLAAAKKKVEGELKEARKTITNTESLNKQLRGKLARLETSILETPQGNNAYSITLHVSNECDLLRTSIEAAFKKIGFRISDPVSFQPGADAIVYHSNDEEIKRRVEFIQRFLRNKFNLVLGTVFEPTPSRAREIKISLR